MEEIEVNGKRVKMVIKEVKNITVACESCREKRRKCDGNSPCAYCSSKNFLCKYSRPKKRGPKKQQNDKPVGNFVISIGPESLESELIDKIEAHNYQCSFFMQYVHLTIPINSLDRLHAPLTISQKVQAYSALAFASRLYGDHIQAKKYISQARVLAGSIFDSPDPDTISAMLMMSNYWQLVLDLPLSYYYGSMACTLAKLISPSRLTDRLAAYCQVVFIMAANMTMQQKAYAITQLSRKLQQFKDNERLRCYGYFLEISSCLVDTFNLNVFAASPEALPSVFETLDNVHLTKEGRDLIVDRLVTADTIYGDSAAGEPLTFVRKIYCPLYRAIADWRSGRVIESMEAGQACLSELQKLRDANGLGILAEFPHLSMFASLAKAFYENNCAQLGEKLCENIKAICKIMEPEYSFLSQRTDQLMEKYRNSQVTYIPSGPIFDLSSSFFTPNSDPQPASPSSNSSSSPSSSSPSSPHSPSPSFVLPYDVQNASLLATPVLQPYFNTSPSSSSPSPSHSPTSTIILQSPSPVTPPFSADITSFLPSTPNPSFQTFSAASPSSLPAEISPFSPNPNFPPISTPLSESLLDTMLREFADPLPNTPGIDTRYL